ncbi:prephenate dehydrogenase [Streptomyces sp. Rer75]|uniref:prephenate dehydrogenase n=1 Tax=Streptomyces sp. Rer75 TaxID=2750011 RepID=UPI00211E3678|nr:prephenate dehydrogenase [Streptomyces sp. Rer75]
MVNALSADNSVGSTIEALKAELPQLEKQQEALKGDLDAVTQRLEVVSTALSSLQALSGATLPQAGNGDVAEAKAAGNTATEAEPKLAAEAAPATRTPAATRKAAIGRQRSKAKSTTGGRATKTATKAAGKKTAAKKPAKKAAAKDTTKTTAKATTKATTKAAKTTEKSAQTSEKATAKATEKTAKAAGTSSERSTGLAESVLGALKKAGRPMRASEVNEALGRDETRTNVNSVRNTLERLRTTDRAKRSGRGLYEAAATS